MGQGRWARAQPARGTRLAALVAVVMLASVVTSTGVGAVTSSATATPPATSPKASGGIGQIYLTGLGKGAAVTLTGPNGKAVGRGHVDRLGSLVFRNLKQGATYRARDTTSKWSAKVRVL